MNLRFRLRWVAVIGLYDHQGLLRFVGHDRDACQAYVELFELEADRVTLEPLGDDGEEWVWVA